MQYRTDDPELLDGDSVSRVERLEALAQLPLVNRFLGGARATLAELTAVWTGRMETGGRLRVLDAGCGAADIPAAIVRWAAARGVPAAVELASRRTSGAAGTMAVVRGDVLRLPIADRGVDVVTANMICHHFSGDRLLEFIRELTRAAAVAVIINDLRRHPAAFWGFRLASRAFLRGHVVRHDGEVSVRRGFRPDELWELAMHFRHFRWTVTRRFAFRLCLVGCRESG